MSILHTKVNKINFFKIKRLNEESLNPKWSYSWRVFSNKTDDKSFYTIQEVNKENESSFSQTLTSCHITFQRNQLPGEEFVVKCYINYGEDSDNMECVYEQSIIIESSESILGIAGIALNTCCDYIEDIKTAYVFISKNTNDISAVLVSINSGKICNEFDYPSLQSLRINYDETSIYQEPNSPFDGCRYVQFRFKWDETQNISGYKLTATAVSVNGNLTSQPLSETYNPIFNILTGRIESSLLGNSFPKNSLRVSNDILVSYKLFLDKLQFFKNNSTTFTIKRFYGVGDTLINAIDSSTYNVINDIYDAIFVKNISDILSIQPQQGLVIEDKLNYTYFYEKSGPEYYFVTYTIEYNTPTNKTGCSSCMNVISFTDYINFEECVNSIHTPEWFWDISFCASNIYVPDADVTITLDTECPEEIPVPPISIEIEVEVCEETIIKENFPCVTTCTETTVKDNFPCVITCTETTVKDNFPCVTTCSETTVKDNFPCVTTCSETTVKDNFPCVITCTETTVKDNFPCVITCTETTVKDNFPCVKNFVPSIIDTTIHPDAYNIDFDTKNVGIYNLLYYKDMYYPDGGISYKTGSSLTTPEKSNILNIFLKYAIEGNLKTNLNLNDIK